MQSMLGLSLHCNDISEHCNYMVAAHAGTMLSWGSPL